MKAKLLSSVKKIAAVATGALFLGATAGAASVFASGATLSGLPSPFVSNGHVSATVVVGQAAVASDIVGAIDIASALTAAAAATHTSTSGVVTIGTLSLSATARTSATLGANASTFGAFTPTSANLNKINYSYGSQSIANKNANYTAIENVTFSSANAPYFNGLNVVFPVGSYQISSYVVNRSNSKAMVNLTDNLQYLMGAKTETLINYTTHNFTVGSVQKYTYVKVPSSITLGAHTINLEGVATVAASPSYSELEFTVDNGGTNYMNFTGSGDQVTTGGVTITLGKPALSNTSGTYIPQVSLSSTSLIQNTTNTVNVFGMGAYNASFPSGAMSFTKDHIFINFSSTAKQSLAASLSTASTFGIVGLSNMSLEPLTHKYTAGNITVSTGAAGTDSFKPTSSAVASKVVSFTLTHHLPNVGIGADFRGELDSASTAFSNNSGPDFTLEPFQWYVNTTGARNNVTAPSENIFPLTSGHSYVTNTSGVYTYVNQTATKIPVALLVQLPNGKSFALQFSPVVGVATAGTNNETMNATILYNGSYSLQQKVAQGKTYSFGGYNLTTVKRYVMVGNGSAIGDTNATVVGFSISGPVASLSNGLSFVPGYAKLYASNGTALSSYALSDQLGSLSFDGSKLVFTEPSLGGGTQSVSIVENKSSFGTNISSAQTNTSTDTWGAYVTGVSLKTGSAKFVIPTQNYTLALGGSRVITGKTNYTVGGIVSSGGEVVSVGGASGFTASSLFGTNVFPAVATLDSSFTGSTNSVPVIIVGGPAVNTVAATVLGLSYPSYGAAFTNATGVHSGQSLIQLFSNVSALGHQDALLVAGYSAQDSVQASQVLSMALVGTPVSGVVLNGTKVILSSGSSYSGVTVVSSS